MSTPGHYTRMASLGTFWAETAATTIFRLAAGGEGREFPASRSRGFHLRARSLLSLVAMVAMGENMNDDDMKGDCCWM